MTTDLPLQPAHVQLHALNQRNISSRELLDLHLTRINASDLNAVVTRDDTAARRAAHAVDERRAHGRPTGALEGLPITVKDSFETAHLRTTCGIEDLSDHYPAQDAHAVARLRHAGAVIMGKTNTPAYCQDLHTDNSLFGPTLNPHDPQRTVGGSSGGAAAAVAAGLTAADLGSDLAGSLRLPAHYCGTHALRPTQGLIPSHGHIPRPPGWLTSSDMLTPGPLARHPEDLALLLSALTTPVPSENTPWRVVLPEPSTPPDHLRVAIWADDPRCPVDHDTVTALENFGEALAAAGTTVQHATSRIDMAASTRLFEQLLHATTTATASDGAFASEQALASSLHSDDASPRAMILRHRTQTHRTWLQAAEERARLRRTWESFFRAHDVLLTPAAPTTAIPAGERSFYVNGRERDFFDQTTWANLTSHVGLPSLVIPIAKNQQGLPVSVQMIGAPYADRSLLAIAQLSPQYSGLSG